MLVLGKLIEEDDFYAEACNKENMTSQNQRERKLRSFNPYRTL